MGTDGCGCSTEFPTLVQAGVPINAQIQGSARMELVAAIGRTIQTSSAQGDGQVAFDTSVLRQGLYLIRALDEAGQWLDVAPAVVE